MFAQYEILVNSKLVAALLPPISLIINEEKERASVYKHTFYYHDPTDDS